MISGEEQKRFAQLAATQAAEALVMLLRFATEGGDRPELEDEVVELLLDAARLTMEVEGDLSGDRGQVYGAICKYLEGWA